MNMRGLRLLALLLLGGCAEPPEPSRLAAAEPEPLESDTPARVRPRHLSRIAAAEPSEFPHAPHGGFECRRCHEAVPGHEGHAAFACSECHDAPPATAERRDCSGCHHSGAVGQACTRCHDRSAAPAAERRVSALVRTARNPQGATRALPFAHARHAQLECVRCHERGAQAAVRVACTSCHDRHHRPDAECRSCHESVAAQVHPPARVHRGCAGAGCHTDATVIALPFSRPLCLVCHPAQAAHEPDTDCAGCHQLNGALP